MSRMTSRVVLYASIAACFIVISDQLVKATIRSSLDQGERIFLTPGLDLVYARNSGIAFGILAGKGTIIIATGLVALIGMAIYLAAKSSSLFAWISFGLLLGGALSNLIDRIFSGAVTDYIDPVLWPAFNLADIAIVIGVLGVLFEAIQPEDNEVAGSNES